MLREQPGGHLPTVREPLQPRGMKVLSAGGCAESSPGPRASESSAGCSAGCGASVDRPPDGKSGGAGRGGDWEVC